jgi:hypothetical protein
MADYQFTTEDVNGPVLRTADQAHIPPDPANRDYAEYQKWLEDGNTPDPYVPPPEPEPAPPAQEDVILYDHENRLRALEGSPPLSVDEFRKAR